MLILPCREDHHNLAHFVNTGIVSPDLASFDLGRTKPDPKGYRMAVSQMGLTLPEVAFVGHDAAELDGARSVGMPTVALSSSPDAAADVRLDRFEQLADVVSLQRPLAAAG
ncbi:MAG: HAD hydrolase-like protein [Thermoguttaceae bacterium]|nr:HAD hydrolase-like protein [Thermoguttaceae bacterium]